MKNSFVVAGLFFSLIIHAQKTPKTPEEMEAFLKDIQRKPAFMQNVLRKKGIDQNTNTLPSVVSGKQPAGKKIRILKPKTYRLQIQQRSVLYRRKIKNLL